MTLLSVILIAGCTTGPNVGLNCSGWRKIEFSNPATPKWLVKNDRKAAEGINNHNSYGERQRCW